MSYASSFSSFTYYVCTILFRRPLDARGVSRDTPRMYGQFLKKKKIDEKDAEKDKEKDVLPFSINRIDRKRLKWILWSRKQIGVIE